MNENGIPRQDALAVNYINTFADTIASDPASYMLQVADAAGLPVGVNVLSNDAASALAIAAATDARFIRVNVHTGSMNTDQGPIHGRAHETLGRFAVVCPWHNFEFDLSTGCPPYGDGERCRPRLRRHQVVVEGDDVVLYT